jgi:2,5-diketo-D-gluconate reductase A
VATVAESRGKTTAGRIRWRIQLGNIVIPESVNPQRIESNFDVFDFELTERDVASISAPEDGSRLRPDPETFDFTG